MKLERRMGQRGPLTVWAITLALNLLLSHPAAADLKALNKCSATLSASMRKLVSAKVKLFLKCADTVTKCSENLTDTEIDNCIASKATPSGKPCASDVLNPTDPATKLGRAIQKFKEKIDGKCMPSDQGGAPENPTFNELVSTTIGASQNANFASGGLRALQIECDDLGFTTALTTWGGATGLRDCLARLAGKAADEQVSASNKRAFAALLRTGMAALADPVPVGKVTVNTDVEIRLNLAGYGLDVTGMTGVSKIDIQGVDQFGVARMNINAEDTSFTPAVINSPTGDTVQMCMKQEGNAFGVICCNGAACTLVAHTPNYQLNQDHDSSGLNPPLLAGEVGPADPTCSRAAPNINYGGIVIPVPPPCSEKAPGLATCNATAVGAQHKPAHFPRCTEGINARKPCTPDGGGLDEITCLGACSGVGVCGGMPCATSDDPVCKTGTCTVLGNPCATDEQCPMGTTCNVDNPCVGSEACSTTGNCSSGTCIGNAFTCRYRSNVGGGNLTNPPCNSSLVFTPQGAPFGDGEMILATKLQFSTHVSAGPLFVDAETFAAGCSNVAGDGKPDTYGCDGLVCTDDDTNQTTRFTVPFLLTTGTVSSTLYDANAVPTSACPAAPGKIQSQNVGDTYSHCAVTVSNGAKPANACANLSQNGAYGYELVATFPLIDQAGFGDGVMSIRLILQ